MKIAHIGVGNMGGAVARCLVGGGFDVAVFDPSAEAMERCRKAGATMTDSAAAVAVGATTVFTSLPTTTLVLETVDALCANVDSSTVIVDISTIDPDTARAAADRCAAAGVAFVACPLGKTPAHAERGEIPIFVGGDGAAIDKLAGVFDVMSEKVYHFGTVEAATTFKLVSNMIGMTNVAVLAEGYELARRAGIEADDFVSALEDTGAASFQSKVRLPWIVADDWAPRFGVDLAGKDVRLAVESANRRKIPTPVSGAALAQLISASVQGYGGEDVVAMAKLLYK